jgi:signal transduction histidine kinase
VTSPVIADRRAPRSCRVAVLAPTGRDAALTARILGQWKIEATVHDGMASLVTSIREGIGTAIVVEEALGEHARAALAEELDRQASWSDLPLIVLTADNETSRALAEDIGGIAARSNVTLLERPVRVATLVTTLRSALRARQRQFDVRDHLIERTNAEAALRAARAQAEEANRTKSEFLAVMSHELRTPLNAIGGYAELIEMGIRGPITADQRADLHRIQQSHRHLLGLINQVLNYTRVDTGTVRYDITDVPVAGALVAAETLVAPQLRAKGLTYTLGTCGPDLVVRADREKLQQILLNLLTNAIKFTKSGGALRVDCWQDGDRVSIAVEDTGIGIAPDKLTSVFEPFVQVDATLTRTSEGVGLGLAISRDLARGMGGELTLESTVGVGSIFTLALPAAGSGE